MAIVVKKSDEQSDVASLYSFGLEQTKLFVGLGNPGDKYDGTRHNIGFACLDHFAASNDISSWSDNKQLKSLVATGTIGSTRIILVKPQTFMNDSGQAARAVMDFYKLSFEDTTVVYDEIDVNLGTIKVSQGGGAAGHNGIKSMIAHLGEGFVRVRVGIGPKAPEQIDLADFVLQRFGADQLDQVTSVTAEASAMLGEATAANLSPQTRSAL